MPVLQSAFVLLVFQLLGELLRAALHAPLPGPVLGMILLAAWYLLRRRQPAPALQATADGLLRFLGLLFVPAGVGIVANLAMLRAAWIPISVALVLSTFLTLILTAWLMHHFLRRKHVC